jgi:hypothetical protein
MAKANAFKPVFINDIVTPPGRLSFPHLINPDTKGQYADDKWKATLIIPKKSDFAKMKAAVLKCAKETWGRDFTLGELMHPFNNGDLKAEKLPDYAGCITVTAKTTKRPMIVGPDRNAIPAEDAYAGCNARLIVTAFSYEQKGKPGVTLLLSVVQFLGDNTPFGKGQDLGVLDDGLTPPPVQDPLDERPAPPPAQRPVAPAQRPAAPAQRPAVAAAEPTDDELFGGSSVTPGVSDDPLL